MGVHLAETNKVSHNNPVINPPFMRILMFNLKADSTVIILEDAEERFYILKKAGVNKDQKISDSCEIICKV